jgi:hypothetical protein
MTSKIINCITVILSLLILIGIAGAQLPSDLIVKQNAPTKLDLSNTAPSSAKAINDLNAKLTKQPKWSMPDIGYLTSEKVTLVQTDFELVTKAIQNFVNGSNALPVSVGNLTGNFTKISEQNGSLAFY